MGNSVLTGFAWRKREKALYFVFLLRFYYPIVIQHYLFRARGIADYVFDSLGQGIDCKDKEVYVSAASSCE